MAISPDGSHIYLPFSGDVIDVESREIVARFADERGRAAGSEKLLEIDRQNGDVARVGNQFGVGRKR